MIQRIQTLLATLIMMLTFYSGAHTQVPGYVGRRWMVQYELGFFPRGNKRDLPPRSYSGVEGFHIHSSHLAGLEWVASRRSVIGLNANFLRTGNGRAYDKLTNAYGRTAIQAIGLGFSSKMYPFLRRGRLAPIGPYWRMDIALNHITSTFYPESRPRISTNVNSRLGLTASIGTGQTFLLSEHLLLDMGFKFNFTDFTHWHIVNGDVGADASTMARSYKLMCWTGLAYLFGK